MKNCRMRAVREYCIVAPQNYTTLVYRFEEDAAPAAYPFDTGIVFGIFPELDVTVAE